MALKIDAGGDQKHAILLQWPYCDVVNDKSIIHMLQSVFTIENRTLPLACSKPTPSISCSLCGTVQSPLYRKFICSCINLFTTARIRNAEHFRRLCDYEIITKMVITPDVLKWFWLFLVCMLSYSSCTQQCKCEVCSTLRRRDKSWQLDLSENQHLPHKNWCHFY